MVMSLPDISEVVEFDLIQMGVEGHVEALPKCEHQPAIGDAKLPLATVSLINSVSDEIGMKPSRPNRRDLLLNDSVPFLCRSQLVCLQSYQI